MVWRQGRQLVTGIRFFDSEAAAVWADLEAAPAVSLLPVGDIDDERRMDVLWLLQGYPERSPVPSVLMRTGS